MDRVKEWLANISVVCVDVLFVLVLICVVEMCWLCCKDISMLFSLQDDIVTPQGSLDEPTDNNKSVVAGM